MPEEISAKDREDEKQVQDLMRTLNREKSGDEFFRRLYGKDPEEMEAATEIRNTAEAKQIAGVLWFASEFRQEWLVDFVKKDLGLRRSLGRKGRKEAVEAIVGKGEQKARGMLGLRRLLG